MSDSSSSSYRNIIREDVNKCNAAAATLLKVLSRLNVTKSIIIRGKSVTVIYDHIHIEGSIPSCIVEYTFRFLRGREGDTIE